MSVTSTLRVQVSVPTVVTETWTSTPTPKITWATSDAPNNWVQASAEISVERPSGTRTFTVQGTDSQLVSWPDEPLSPRESVAVRVKVTGTDGSISDFSDPVRISGGFLGDGEWIAKTLALPSANATGQPFILRKAITFSSEPESVVFYASAHGVYQVWINGVVVDDQFLKPGWTTYQKRVLHETTTITPLVNGVSALVEVRAAGGWFTESFGFQGFAKPLYGEQASFAAQLHVTYKDGSTEVLSTDETWEITANSTIVSSSIYDGEVFDGNVDESEGWTKPTVSQEIDTVYPRVAPPVRCTEKVAPVELITSPSGKTILDFGQNLVGFVEFSTTSLASGQTVTLRHAEVLENEEMGIRPLRLAKATDTYTHGPASGNTWRPEFTFHGFRYLEVSGWNEDLDLSDFTALVLHSDMRRIGDFASSHELLNQLHKNVVWGMRGNFLSLPTDCPQRDERLGWTGDIQVFAPTASFLYDTHMFLDSWLVDLTLEQEMTGNGVVPIVIPDVLQSGQTPMAAWGDAATIVPTVLHERYADMEILNRQLDSMTQWVDSIVAVSSSEWLWEGFFQFGDWLDPTAPPDDAAAAKATGDLVATAHAFRSADLTVKAAQLLGRDDVSAKYGEVRENYRKAFLDNFVTPNGRIVNDAQTAYAMAIEYRIVEDPTLLTAMSKRLAALTREGGYHIETGFVGTPIVHDALAYGNHFDANDRLMFQTENPSWLYPVTMGATTIWERWDSMLEDGSINPGEMTSFNHYALGAVADWLHRRVAGLAPSAPGYASIHVEPIYLPTLEHASAFLNSGFGLIESGWKREGTSIVLEVTIPANTTATVVVPDGVQNVGSGTHSWTFEEDRDQKPLSEITLDSPLLDVLENQPAYNAIVTALQDTDPSAAHIWRKSTKWIPNRVLRESFHAIPRPAVEAALAALTKLG